MASAPRKKKYRPPVLKRQKPKEFIPEFMTMDIETRLSSEKKRAILDDADLESGDRLPLDLLGDTVYITWCIDGKGFGVASDDLTQWLLDYFLVPQRDGYFLYVHNAFGFDMKRIDWGRIANAGFTADILNGNSLAIKSMTIYDEYGRDWTIRDSSLLLPMKLSQLTSTFAPEHVKLSDAIDFSKESFDPQNPKHTEYAIRDSVGLFYGIKKADELYLDLFDVSIHDAATAPGLAFRAFRQSLPEDFKAPGVTFELAHACRLSYHGGQTLVLNTRLHTDEVSIDANSMYPWTMMTFPLPTGDVEHIQGLMPDADPERTLCLAVVNIPEGVFPFLKTQDDTGRVGNFSGTVVGWYWLFELDFQAELGGDYEVIESYEWQKQTSIVADFAGKCKELRFQDYHGPIGTMAKLLGNSLYGKFAQKAPEYNLVMAAECPDNGVPLYDPEVGEEMAYIFQVPPRPNYAADMCHWASFITAHARLRLTQMMAAVGFDNVDYCDTDSVFFERRHMDKVPPEFLGPDYGQFKLEKEMTEFQGFAPKAYKFITTDGKKNVKNKGIPKGELQKQGAYEVMGQPGVVIDFVSSFNLSQMMTKGKGYGRIATRTLATESSTTNGAIQAGTWVPGPCEPMPPDDLRGRKCTPRFSNMFWDIFDEMADDL